MKRIENEACAGVPEYLSQAYDWAYVHPSGIRRFERQWLVSLILMGQYHRLVQAVCRRLRALQPNRVLQLGCAYGHFSSSVLHALGRMSRLTVVDVVPDQLANLKAKIPADRRLHLCWSDVRFMEPLPNAQDVTLSFFLLHEMPESVIRATLAQAARQTRVGGRLILVDYHRPVWYNPFRYALQGVFRALEPYADAFWRTNVEHLMPQAFQLIKKKLYFGGLYQMAQFVRQPLNPSIEHVGPLHHAQLARSFGASIPSSRGTHARASRT